MSSVYYLDTNICVFLFRQKKGGIIEQKIRAVDPKNIKQVVDLCDSFEIVPFDDSTSWVYGKMKAALERKGQLIGYNDMVIAATVLANNGILVTNNTKEFSRIDGLQLDDWTQE